MPTSPRSSPARPPASAAALLLALAILPAAALGAGQAPPCRLPEAQAEYEVGRFDEARELALTCLETRLSAVEQVEAHAILAKVYLVLDEVELAEREIHRVLEINPNFTPASGDPPRFVRGVEAARSAPGTVEVVTSVSRTSESLHEAPATVVVVTAEEIAHRGYRDLSEVFDDLPGFDVTRGSGDIYASLYQRGYRSNNDRTLFLVDGVEENDLWGNSAQISRQYALSDVDRIEVVYGPASTMYGANAFVGVINVITKDPEELIAQGKRLGVHARLGGGTWNTRWADVSVAGRNRSHAVRFSLTGRVYRSDEQDLSRYPDWDYDPRRYDELFAAGRYDEVLGLSPDDPADQALAQRARDLDKAALGQRVEGRPVAFSDRTDDWSLYAKVRLANLTVGISTWRREEGLNGWYTDGFYPGADNGSIWAPEQTFTYLRYDRDVGRLGTSVFASFLRHRLGNGTREEQLRDYASGRLTRDDLEAGVESFWRRTDFDQSSRQVRGGVTLTWGPSPGLDLVGGAEVRSGLIQGDYLLTIHCPDRPDGVCPGGERENRRDTEGSFFDQTDVGLFAQASFRPHPAWRLVAGGRLDYDAIRAVGGDFAVVVPRPDGGEDVFRPEGYGTVFTPRLAVVWSRGHAVLKAIYAEAFKDASNFSRYATSPGFRDLPNPSLDPERVRNFELAVGWHPMGRLTAGLAAYRAQYSNAVASRPVALPDGTTTLQNQAVGELETLGAEATVGWRLDNHRIDANLTWTDPHVVDAAAGDPRVADIARWRANLLTNSRFGERWQADLRLNWVGERPAGAGTSVANPEGAVPSYFVANAAVTYALPWRSGARLQLVVDNLLDARYDHPGIGSADGEVVAARLPQPRRAVFLRLEYDF